MFQKKTQKITLVISVLFTWVILVIPTDASVSETAFDGVTVWNGWNSAGWNWDVEQNGSQVIAKPWGGVYFRYERESHIEAENIESLTIKLRTSKPLRVSLICDCGDQPYFEAYGNIHIPAELLIANGTKTIHGIMIQNQWGDHTYDLDHVSLQLDQPLVPMETATPTAFLFPTNTPQPLPATNTPVPKATSTPLPPPATDTPYPEVTSTFQPMPVTNTPTPKATSTSQPTLATNTPHPEGASTPHPPPVTNTPYPEVTSTFQPTLAPTRDHSNCGPLLQQAEAGKIQGGFAVIEDRAGVRGQSLLTESRSSEKMSNQHRVDYCFHIQEAGKYQVRSRVIAKDLSQNSMYVAIDSIVLVWHMELSESYVDQMVSNGGSVNGRNPAATIYLSQGTHDISFYHRESDVRLDEFEIVPAMQLPTSTPTLSPTQTPTPSEKSTSLESMIDHYVDYSNVGINGGIPQYHNTITVRGWTENAIEDAINRAQPNTRIILPAGTYNIGTIDINKSNIVLAGAEDGCGETVLKFSSDSGIRVGSSGRVGSSTSVTANAARNTKIVRVSTVSGLNVGDYVLIRQNDDSSLFRIDLSRNPSETWVKNNATQINKIVSINANTLTLEGGLNLDYKTSLNAQVAKIHNMISGVGIENLTLEKTSGNNASHETGNIYFDYAANSWVRGVHSKNAVRAHFYFNRSYKSEVRGSYLDAARNNGSGGNGYGVRLEDGTTDILIENNIARLMRHSYIAQTGANGNVFAYNYSADPYGEGFGEIYTDLSVHGGFAHSNLFEGNQAQAAKVDNIHASNTGNLYLRNRLEQDLENYTYQSQLRPKGATTPHIWIHENQYFNSFLGNEIGFPEADKATQTIGFPNGNKRENFTVCKYTTSGRSGGGCGRTRDTTINHGTYDYLLGQMTWDSSISRNIPDSAYKNDKPSFWGNTAWPSFGPDTLDLSETEKMIPAKSRFLNASQGHSSYCYIDG